VSKTYNDLESARQQYLLLDSSIELARESLRLQELSFREGQVTSLDVIDAQLQLGGAMVERAQAAYEYDVALARLLEISGGLDHYPDYFRRADKVLQQ
jgi:outer membrane protein TolC